VDPISNADRLVLLLRQKLQERARASAAGRGTSRSEAEKQGPSALQALAAIEGSDERPLRRAFIQNLLADQLGAAFLNDAQFQQIVTRVTDAIEEDEVASGLLSRLIADLRAS
jgi:hypothetical protein